MRPNPFKAEMTPVSTSLSPGIVERDDARRRSARPSADANRLRVDPTTGGEGQCEDRNIALDFCANGSTMVATGALDVCRCWFDGNSPSCGADENLSPVDASATRMEP